MFEIGQQIIYGNAGVCVVDNIGKLESSGRNDRDYYTLKPIYLKESRIYTPVDNEKVVMRPVLTKKEANKLIKDIPNIEELGISDEKHREQEYKDAIATADCNVLIGLIKTIYPRKQQRLAEGKKVTANDERYYNMAEEYLYKELAISLDKSVDDAKEYVEKKVKKAMGD